MGILTNLIFSVVNLVFIVIDILLLLIMVRIACYRWNAPWLKAIDSAGNRLINWFTEYIRKTMSFISNRTCSQRTILMTGMIILIFVRFILTALFSKG